jgi:hypothetical protein
VYPGQTIGAWQVEAAVDINKHDTYQMPTTGQCVDLNGEISAGAIYQDVPTPVGGVYQLNLFLAGNPDGAPAVKQLEIRWDGNVVATPTFDTTGKTRQDMGWQLMSYSVTAAASPTRLRFSSLTTTSAYGPMIAGVSVALTGGDCP